MPLDDPEVLYLLCAAIHNEDGIQEQVAEVLAMSKTELDVLMVAAATRGQQILTRARLRSDPDATVTLARKADLRLALESIDRWVPKNLTPDPTSPTGQAIARLRASSRIPLPFTQN